MQTVEAILSFFFLVTIASAILQPVASHRIDDSLYRLQLAQDSWRVLYLRGNFNAFSDLKRPALEQDMGAIGDQTGLCIFMSGVQFTNCRGGDRQHEITATIQRTLVYDGVVKTVSFSIGR